MEHNAVRAAARALPDGFLDGLVPEEVAPGLLRSDAVPSDPSVSDASDVAPLDATADERHQRRRALLVGAVAGKSAVLAQDGRARDGPIPSEHWPAPSGPELPDAAAAPCTQGAGQSAEQSFAAQAVAVLPGQKVAPDAECSKPQVQLAAQKPQSSVPPVAEEPAQQRVEAAALLHVGAV